MGKILGDTAWSNGRLLNYVKGLPYLAILFAFIHDFSYKESFLILLA